MDRAKAIPRTIFLLLQTVLTIFLKNEIGRFRCMEIVDMVILRIRNSRSIINSVKWSDLGMVTKLVVVHMFRHPSVMEEVKKTPVPSPPKPFPKVWRCFGISFRLFHRWNQEDEVQQSSCPNNEGLCDKSWGPIVQKNLEMRSEKVNPTLIQH